MVVNKADFPKIAVIGGGTGGFTILQELKYFTPNIAAIVSMSDSGGSTGKLRDELGILPPGDERKCLAALCEAPELREVLNYRFNKGSGSLEEHTVGNILVAAFEKLYGKQNGIKVASKVMRIVGEVVPVSLDNHQLVMRDGQKIIKGEGKIDYYKTTSKNPTVYLEPKAKINPQAAAAIKNADLVVVTPGSVYTSLLAVLSVDGMKQAIKNSPAKKIIITNLVTTAGQTDGWHAVDYVEKLESVLGGGTFDFILYNNHLPSAKLLKKYQKQGELPVAFDTDRFGHTTATLIADNFIAGENGDSEKLRGHPKPTLVRHNARKVCQHLMEIYRN